MAVVSKKWTFKQLSAPTGHQPLTIELSGAAAPYGRPRQKEVVGDELELRESVTYYPGNDNTPTRHIFGTKWSNINLSGRWRDAELAGRNLGATARELVQLFQKMLNQAQPVEVTWGDILHLRGYIKKFKANREAEYEVVWELEFLVDENFNDPVPLPTPPRFGSPSELAFQNWIETGKILNAFQNPKKFVTIETDFFDALDDNISAINSYSAALLKIAEGIDAFETAAIGQIERLRGGILQIRTAALNLNATLARAKDDTIYLARTADGDVLLQAGVAAAEAQLVIMLEILNELERQAELAQRAQEVGLYIAILGDSWESISILNFGDTNQADKIRKANGVRYGERPIAGYPYIIPRK